MGYGDEILVTAEAREIKKKFPNAKILVGNGKKTFPSIIFQNNPNISQNENINNMDLYMQIFYFLAQIHHHWFLLKLCLQIL